MEVIDLISSSPPAISISKPQPDAKTISSTKTPALPSRQPVAQREPAHFKKDDDEWFCLSDDEEPHNDVNTSAMVGWKPCVGLALPHGKLRTEGKDIFDDNFWSLGNDDVDEVAASARNKSMGLEGRGHASGRSKEKAKGDNDFFFLSNDFDTTVNLDESFGAFGEDLEPARKKRRLTPEPVLRFNAVATVGKEKGLQRAVSDFGAVSRTDTNVAVKPAVLRRSKSNILDDDPIIFTSSPDDFRAAREKRDKLRRQRERELEEDDPFASDDINQSARSSDGHHKRANASIDTLSSDDLPDLGSISSQAHYNIPALSRKGSQKALEEYNAEKAAVKKTKDKAQNVKIKARSTENKPRAAQEKLEAKEAEKERKRLAREDKAREKQMAADLAKVNTLRIHKKDSTPEMIIDIPADLEPRLANQVRQFLGLLDVECAEWNSPIPNVIKWRRKVESTYNQEMGHWEPCPKHIKPENHVMCVMTAKEFVDLATGGEGQDLDAHVLKMKTKFPGCTLLFLLEGLTAWMRKNRNVKNRQFTEAVRSQMALEEASLSGPPTAAPKPRKKKTSPEHIDEDLLEDALLKLQVLHQTLIHHTSATVDTAEQIRALTQHISTIPYRHERMALEAGIGFCMESGQIATGTDATDTWIKMLQEISRVTAPVAYGIAARYPSVQALVKGFETEGKDALAELRKCANRDGAVMTDKRLGNRVSRRLWAIFTGRDEGSVDV
jgi:crossover junction endonuclease EME1